MPAHAEQVFNIGLLFLSFGTAFLGSYISISVLEQLRSIYLHKAATHLLIRIKWYILIGVALGGIGIWTMHFVGMAAMKMKLTDTANNRVLVPIDFDVWKSVLSVVVVIITTALGAYVGSFDRLFAKSKSEILEMFIEEEAKNLSMGDVKRLKNWMIIKIMCTKDLRFLVCGGMIAGSGVCIMHYLGMSAMVFPGHIHWDIGIIAASILIAIIAATAAFWILYRVLSVFPSYESLRMISAAIMMVAVCGMHYTGMAAATMVITGEYEEPIGVEDTFFTKEDVLVPLVVCEMIICWALALFVFAHLRHIVYRYRYLLKKHHAFHNNHNSSSMNSFSSAGSTSFTAPHSTASNKYLPHLHPHPQQRQTSTLFPTSHKLLGQVDRQGSKLAKVVPVNAQETKSFRGSGRGSGRGSEHQQSVSVSSVASQSQSHHHLAQPLSSPQSPSSPSHSVAIFRNEEEEEEEEEVEV